MTHKIPPAMASGPFTSATALEVGLSRRTLRGRRFRQLFHGVHILASLELTLQVWLRGALLILPRDAVVSHTSAMELWGFRRPHRFTRLELSTNTSSVTKHKGILLHRRLGRLTRYERAGLPVTGPDRTFVDCATRLSYVELVQFGEVLLHTKASTLESLERYVNDRHLDGVRRARRALVWIREGVESPRETLIRLMLTFARLPEPACNVIIERVGGEFLARGDLCFVRWKVLVEYDGAHHGAQQRRDRERRERLEAAGWRVIVIMNEDLRDPRSVPWRVYAALKQRGYEGPAPLINDSWMQWFGKAHQM
ncbi:DUF559 domain-containing protein [Aeromicrobium sp.]|uniref:DUF559 domain-containing protein n=1 Tax=Aeromicrobium sp. TaxID=1871063 RepID=UPI0030C43D98